MARVAAVIPIPVTCFDTAPLSSLKTAPCYDTGDKRAPDSNERSHRDRKRLWPRVGQSAASPTTGRGPPSDAIQGIHTSTVVPPPGVSRTLSAAAGPK